MVFIYKIKIFIVLSKIMITHFTLDKFIFNIMEGILLKKGFLRYIKKCFLECSALEPF